MPEASVLFRVICVAAAVLLSGMAPEAASELYGVKEVVDVAPVWSAHPVGFCLLTHGDQQYVAFYDADRRMTVAQRTLDTTEWTMVRLPEQVKWDSHNSVTMALDAAGCIHLSGNMHCAPLVYFKTREPGNITTFERVTSLVGEFEDKCTYPAFVTGPKGEFIFEYRHGSSGNGINLFNVYDPQTQSWRRLADGPLLDGKGEMNAYPIGPETGPDGWYHMVWVWRDTPDCATNHDLSYARSKDLVLWETSRGEPLTLPITIDNCEIVDPVPPGGGIINGNTRIGFDTQNRVILSYHKFDEAGNTQIYNARLEDGAWKIYQASDWTKRWEFSGNGAIQFDVRLSGVSVVNGSLVQSFSSPESGGTWELDPATLKPAGKARRGPARSVVGPEKDRQPESDFPGMRVQWRGDACKQSDETDWYVLRWETLGPNRDQPREEPWPAPSMLRVYKMGLSVQTGD
ncbi:MAG TPA: BNR repeat-containing protein [Candidatus Hydrogenedentes bacterium]|mgnify:FL=1|nr:BNR repeat-containing protein [Candidatus Hydrogenedentota bacterium]